MLVNFWKLLFIFVIQVNLEATEGEKQRLKTIKWRNQQSNQFDINLWNMRYKALSLFSGCGGLDLGFHANGIEIVVAIDNDPAAIRCYNYNFKAGGLCMDVKTDAFAALIRSLKGIDIVIGGFPCQGFSKSGPKKKDDPRNSLYESMLLAVKKLKPTIFVAENVDGLAQNYQGTVLKKIIDDFSEIGYSVQYRIIDAADFGVPQHRRRVIFVGTYRKSVQNVFNWPTPGHRAKVRNGEFLSEMLLKADYDLFSTDVPSPPKTVRDAIGDLVNIDSEIDDQQIKPNISNDDLMIIQKIGEGQKLCNVRFSQTSVYTWQIPEVFGQVTKKESDILATIAKNRRKKKYGTIPNGNPLSIEVINSLMGTQISMRDLKGLQEKGYIKETDGKFDIKGAMFCSGLYKRPLWDEPSPTIITFFYHPRYMLHPSENRPLSIRECARLQSFPDEFKFLKSGITIEESYRVIGNAVPPKLGAEIAISVVKYLEQNKKDEIKPTLKRQAKLAQGIRSLGNSVS